MATNLSGHTIGNQIHVGDSISALGYTFKVEKILNQEWWDRYGYDVEFLDDRGNYHHWKQGEDGGEVIRQKKKIFDWYGTDVTDIFRKYGYNV